MGFETKPKSEYVIVDTSAFIRNANLQEIGKNIITIPEVVNEIKSKRQLRRLVVLPYDLQIKEAFPEYISHVSEFAKKTGDYPSLSSTDLKVMALTYQFEKELVGVEHLKSLPEINRCVDYCNHSTITADSVAGFYKPKKGQKANNLDCEQTDNLINDDEDLVNEVVKSQLYYDEDEESDYLSACSSNSSDVDEFSEICDYYNTSDNKNEENVQFVKSEESFIIEDSSSKNNSCDDERSNGDDFVDELFTKVNYPEEISDNSFEGSQNVDDEDDDSGWITPSNVRQAKEQMDGDNLEEKPVKVACLTMDFAMQNVLKQMGLNILSLDGRIIKQMRTFILRCYACFKTTSVMTKVFCHHCGNKTLKKVAVSLDANGNQKIHINLRRPLTARGKRFSLPKPTGGKHSNYPILFEDQPLPDQRPSRLARMKNNPLDPDYIAGYSPFVMRDVNSKSAMLGITNNVKGMKYWMKKNPNESFGKRKKKK